ncbi:MAG: Gfo/Idh/MocA family oxidoreductase [Clostridia bacterium]|nr:Gfo/Idh/MocA family oxidoreductase [Clostridia bacterium]
MENKQIKLGLFGLGMRGYYGLNDILQCENIKLVAICDKDEGAVAQAQARLAENGVTDVVSYTDYDEMLKNEDIDSVFVFNYATEHTPAAIKALESGKNVLSEIPAVTSVEEARALKATVLAHPEVKYMFAENCCYWANMESWKTMREEGKFGEIVCAEGEYLHSEEPSEITAERFEGKDHWRMYNPAIRYLTHELGPLLEIMDDRVVRVTCMEPAARYNPYKRGPENGAALFFTEKGAVIRILICFGAYCGATHNYRIIGTKGSIETTRLKNIGEAYSYASLEEVPGSFMNKTEIPITISHPGEGEGGHGGADKRMMYDFADCVLTDREPRLNVDKAIQISLPGVLAHDSAVLGGALIEMPEI